MVTARRHQTRVFHKGIVAKDSGKRPQGSAVARGASGGVSSIAHLGADYRRLNQEAQRRAATGGSKGELKVGNRTVCPEWMIHGAMQGDADARFNEYHGKIASPFLLRYDFIHKYCQA